jgi:hypothetical protein
VKVDIVDFNGSFLARVRDFAGANPIILVITKVIVLCIHSVFLYCPVLFFYHYHLSTKATSFLG